MDKLDIYFGAQFVHWTHNSIRDGVKKTRIALFKLINLFANLGWVYRINKHAYACVIVIVYVFIIQ